jgi:hypothetical protein
MKIYVSKIEVGSYELAMDIIKGLEHGSLAGKYECIFHPVSEEANRRGGVPHMIEIYALESDKTPIGFADSEETK